MDENKVDINSLIGFFLIGLIFIGWLYLNPPPPTPVVTQTENNEVNIENESPTQDLSEVLSVSRINDSQDSNLSFENSLSEKNELVKIDTEKFIIEFSTLGGQISSLELKGQLNYLGEPVNLIQSKNSTFNLDFTTKNGRIFNTKDQKFIYSTNDLGSVKQVSMKLMVSEDVFIEYLYSVNQDDYIIDLDINSRGFYNILDTSKTYNLNWELSAFRNSKSISYENRYSYLTYFHDDDKIDYLSISGDDEDDEENINWISFKQHFFSSIIIAENENPFKNVEFKSEDLVQDNNTDTLYTKKFISKIPFDYSNNEFDNSLKFYFGPNQYSQLETYNIGLEESVDFGWGIFGFINKNVFVPLYRFLSGLFPYGIAIIFMTIIVRIVLAPVLYKSYLSQAKMKILRPELDEINKKFKDNAMKRQQEMMSLYRKAGANPMSGCLPGLLQIPVFYALFMFFPSAFDLRQKSFLWADDLSAYDSILDFGFYIPLYGDHVSLFPILASVSIFFYMKMTTGQQMASQPQPQEGMPDMTKMMKYMIYFAPIMMMVFFNNYSSGLSLYYFISNLLSIGIMFTIKNYILDEKKIRQQIQFNKSQPVKPPSRFQRKMQAIMDEAERQKKNK
ncbi:MAG: membrane protein insertase YidC [Flavobacteriaceae bacterium]|nr:membrane protein insertase YidC [Flavobacteriaceae bacterium]|tara:strand:+ start:3719 stop:5572 length:1854 start_codon:yes stop_codon:yes gene_type:complete